LERENGNALRRWREVAACLGDAVAGVCLVLAALALIAVVAINGVNVVARYFFGSPFSWAEELMLFLMILGGFAGANAITWRNRHVRSPMFRRSRWRRCACGGEAHPIRSGNVSSSKIEMAGGVPLNPSSCQRRTTVS
jgi:hypothetical protein